MDLKTFIAVLTGLAILHAIIVLFLGSPFPISVKSTGASPLLITEVELNPPCDVQKPDCRQWVEVGNTTSEAFRPDVWYVSRTAGEDTATLALAEHGCSQPLPVDSYCVVAKKGWLPHAADRVILNGLTSQHFYQTMTPRLRDEAGDGRSWQLCPDQHRWIFRPATRGQSNRCDWW